MTNIYLFCIEKVWEDRNMKLRRRKNEVIEGRKLMLSKGNGSEIKKNELFGEEMKFWRFNMITRSSEYDNMK